MTITTISWTLSTTNDGITKTRVIRVSTTVRATEALTTPEMEVESSVRTKMAAKKKKEGKRIIVIQTLKLLLRCMLLDLTDEPHKLTWKRSLASSARSKR